MRAVLHTGFEVPWTSLLGRVAWPLLPLGNRPLIEYWLHLCTELGIKDVTIVLGEGAEHVEAFTGDGDRWGLKVTYSFLRSIDAPEIYLQRNPNRWEDGLFYVAAPIFLGKTGAYALPDLKEKQTYCYEEDGKAAILLSTDPKVVHKFFGDATGTPDHLSFNVMGLRPEPVQSVQKYYELNMRLVAGEADLYVAPGYETVDGCSIGYNVVLPPSVRVNPPVMIGNNCRLSPLVSIGPNAVISNWVVVDKQTDLANCVVLDGTYIGRNLEIKERIVAGTILVDPEDGTSLDVADAWLLASVKPTRAIRDSLQAVLGWLFALLICSLQVVPFFLLFALIRLSGRGRYAYPVFHVTRKRTAALPLFETRNNAGGMIITLFRHLSLDLFPRILRVLSGRLWLCGTEPLASPERDDFRAELKQYYPGAYSYSTTHPYSEEPGLTQAETFYYGEARSLSEDLSVLIRTFLFRLIHG